MSKDVHNNRKKTNSQKDNCSDNKIDALKELLSQGLTTEQIAVITAILTNTVSVNAVFIYKDQKVQIVLEGTVRKKTKMDKLLDQMSGLSVGDLLNSISNR